MAGVGIYALIDPRTTAVRYVGKSCRPRARLSSHLSDAKAGRRWPVHNWLRQLIRLGARPILNTLETCDESVWVEREKYWIAEMRRRGVSLLNLTDGGEGITMTPQTRAKISAAHKGRSAPWVSEMNRARAGGTMSAETKAKMSATRSGRPLTPAHKERMREVLGERNASEKQRLAVSKAHKGKIVSTATRAKISAYRKGRKHSAETKAKISASSRGVAKPEGFGAKIAEANKRRWAKWRELNGF